MYTRGGKSTVEKPTLVNKPKIYKGRLGEVREARGGKSTKPMNILIYDMILHFCFWRSETALVERTNDRFQIIKSI